MHHQTSPQHSEPAVDHTANREIDHSQSGEGINVEDNVAPSSDGFNNPLLPDIPSGDLAIDLTLTSIAESNPSTASESPDFNKLQKRASNVLKLSEENNKLKEELAAMTARLEAAERRKTELRARSNQHRTQQIMEAPSS